MVRKSTTGRKIIIWNEHETTSVVVSAYKLSKYANYTMVYLFQQAQSRALPVHRQRKFAAPITIGDYANDLWKEINSWTTTKADAYAMAWEAGQIKASMEARPRGMHARNTGKTSLPKEGWDWKPPEDVASEVDHEQLRQQALAELAKEKEAPATPATPGSDQITGLPLNEVQPEGVTAPLPVVEVKARGTFVTALRDYMQTMIQIHMDTVIREVTQDLSDKMIKPLLRPLVQQAVQDEIIPLVAETVNSGLNNALDDLSKQLRTELDALTGPGQPQANSPVQADEEVELPMEKRRAQHHVVIFGLQPDEFMRVIQVVAPLSQFGLEVHHAREKRDVHHLLRDDTKLIHMIKMSAHLDSAIKEKVGYVYPVDGGVSEARKVILDIARGTNRVARY
jgi:hypothetical protein